MAYIVPENALTSDYTCKRIFIPDTLEYRAIFLGMLDYITKWVAWEDGQKTRREKTAAEVWKVALDLTLDAWPNGCEQMTEDDIRTLIEQELDKMTINNCITVNCGCGAGSGIGDFDGLPPSTVPVGTLPPLPDTDQPPPTSSYLQYYCDMCHWLVYGFRLVSMRCTEITGIGEEQYNRVDDVFEQGFHIYDILWDTFYAITMYFLNFIAGTSAADIAAAIDGNYDALVCALYGGDGLEDKRSRFRAEIDNLPLSTPVRYWLKMIEQSMPYELLYSNEYATFDFGTYPTNRACACGDTEGDPLPVEIPVTSDYRIVMASLDTWDNEAGSEPTTTVTSSGDWHTVNYSTQDTTTYSLSTNLRWVIPTMEPAEQIVGMIFQTKDYAADFGRGFELTATASWGVEQGVVSGNPAVPLYPDREATQSIIYQYQGHGDALTPLLDVPGAELTLDPALCDGSYSRVTNTVGASSPDSMPTATISVRAFHIIYTPSAA